MKTSLIITTKNEEQTIHLLLDTVLKQTELPDEVIIADAGSTDHTRDIIQSYTSILPIHCIQLNADANRAVGRNCAIEAATHEHILITDSGCRLHKNWVKEMKLGCAKADVVAGYYTSDAWTHFERASAPYALVMPDKVNPNNFLPATRSMGITKKVWNDSGRFNEKYRFAEDYEFARRLRAKGTPIHFAKHAIVYWRPRPTWTGFAKMIYEHAYGDAFSRTFRPKVAFIFVRYLIWLILLLLAPISSTAVFLFSSTWTLYIVFSIQKNLRYAPHWINLLYLPALQVLSDFAVMWGTIRGFGSNHSVSL